MHWRYETKVYHKILIVGQCVDNKLLALRFQTFQSFRHRFRIMIGLVFVVQRCVKQK